MAFLTILGGKRWQPTAPVSAYLGRTFGPPLDKTGNTVKGQLVTRFLARRLGLDLFSSEPVG